VTPDEKRVEVLKQTKALIIMARVRSAHLSSAGRKPEADWWQIAIAHLEAWLPVLNRPGSSTFTIPREMAEDYDKVMRGLAIRGDVERIRQNLPALMEASGHSAEQIESAVEEATKSSRGRPRDTEGLEALELKISGQSLREIAKRSPGSDLYPEQAKDRVKKSLKRLRPLYDDLIKKYSEK